MYLCNVERCEAKLRKSRVKRRDQRLLLRSLEAADACTSRVGKCSDGSWRVGGRLELGGHAGRLELGGDVSRLLELVKLLQRGATATNGASILAPQLSHLFPTVFHQRLVLGHSQLLTFRRMRMRVTAKMGTMERRRKNMRTMFLEG